MRLRGDKFAPHIWVMDHVETEQALVRSLGLETMSAGNLVLLLDLFDVSWEDCLRCVRAKLNEAKERIR